MRVAILADIHGNLPAAEAVMEDIKRQAPDLIVAAGDLALRGPYPKETVDLMVDRCDAILMGNTDCYLAGNYLSGAYREKDHWKVELLEWTRAELGEQRVKLLGSLPFSVRYSPRHGQDLFVCHANPKNLEESLEPTLDDTTLRRFLAHVDAAAVAFGHLHFPYRRRLGRTVVADVASAGIPRDGDLRPAWGLFTYTPRGWRVQIRRVRYPVRRTTQALTDRRVPGAPLLIHKMIEARYRHHHALIEAARRHSGLPPAPVLRPPPGARNIDPVVEARSGEHPLPVEAEHEPVDFLDEQLDLHGAISAPSAPSLDGVELHEGDEGPLPLGEFDGAGLEAGARAGAQRDGAQFAGSGFDGAAADHDSPEQAAAERSAPRELDGADGRGANDEAAPLPTGSGEG